MISIISILLLVKLCFMAQDVFYFGEYLCELEEIVYSANAE